MKMLSKIFSCILLFMISFSYKADATNYETIEELVDDAVDEELVTQFDYLILAELHRELFIDEISKIPNEKFVLFTLAPGNGIQYRDAVKMQKLPDYFVQLTKDFPACSAKIFAIDPSFSLDSNAPEYAFLYDNDWEVVKKEYDYAPDGQYQPVRFAKENIEIVFFKFVIPDRYSQELSENLLKFTSHVLEHGGCVFMGHHGAAFGGFSIFSDAYNALLENHPRANNILMYICSGNESPHSNPKVYHNVPYHREELNTLYELMRPWFTLWTPSPKCLEWERLSWENQLEILDEYLEGFTPSYQLYYDLSSFNVYVDVKPDGPDGTFNLNMKLFPS